jgi:hypothetical protein
LYFCTLLLFHLILVSHAEGAVLVSWSWLSEIDEQGFELERSPEGCADWAVIAVNPANLMSVEDIDVPGNCYRVRAFDQAKYYPYSNVGTVPPAPPPPPPPDTTKPIVAITSPESNSVVTRRATVAIRSTVSDNVKVVSVRYFVNGAMLNCAALATSCNWSVPNPPNKTYTITIEARDQAGNLGAAQAAVRSGR